MRRKILPLPLFILMFAGVSAALGNEFHSNGIGGGDWSDAGSWREKTVPTANDDVVVSRDDVIAFDRNDEGKISCHQLFIDPKGALTFKSGAGRAVLSLGGAVESYGTIKIDASQSPSDRFELRLAGPSLDDRRIKLLKGAALLASGNTTLEHGKHNVAISAPPVTGETKAGAIIEAGQAVVLDLHQAELVNVQFSAHGIDNTGGKPNERLNFAGNHFTGWSHLALNGCDSPAIVDNAFELTGTASFNEPAIGVTLCPLAEIRGNVFRGRYTEAIQGRQQVDSAVTGDTFDGCISAMSWEGKNAMFKGLIVKNCDTAVTAHSVTGVLEEIQIENCRIGYVHEIATTQLTHVEITKVPKDGMAVAYRSGPLTLLNCKIEPEEIKPVTKDKLEPVKFTQKKTKALKSAKRQVGEGTIPAVTSLYYLVVAPKGKIPPGATVELRTADAPAPSAEGAIDSNVRNSPAKILSNGLTPLPDSLMALTVKGWTLDNDMELTPAPEYTLQVTALAEKPGMPGRPLATMKVTPDGSWYRLKPNDPKPTVEIKLK